MTVWPAELVVRPLSKDDVKAVAGWRYPGPWAVYDHGDDLDQAGYRAVVSNVDGELIGFYCIGLAARVPGIEPDDAVVDLGIGMTPGWVGRGHGADFARAVLDDIRRDHPGMVIRAVIQSWNRRSVRLAQRLGFVATGTHRCFQDGREVEYTVLVQE